MASFNNKLSCLSSIKQKIDSLEEKIQKLDSLDEKISNIQFSRADSPMDTTPMPHSNAPLPSTSPLPQPPSLPPSRQSNRPTYAQATGSKIPSVLLPLPTPQPKTSTSVPKGNTWIIQFPKNNRYSGERLTPLQLVQQTNDIYKLTDSPVKAILAKWTLKHNLSITFSPESTDKDIEGASKSVIHFLFPDQTDAIFSKATPWSKIVFKNTMCCTLSTDLNHPGTIAVKEFSPEELLKAVKDSHPLLKEATFIHPPDWTVKSLPDTATQHNLCFTIEDPDGIIANNLIASEVIMFATTV